MNGSHMMASSSAAQFSNNQGHDASDDWDVDDDV